MSAPAHKYLSSSFKLLVKVKDSRIVTNSSHDAPVDALIQKLKRPSIAGIIKRETTIMAYKSLDGLAPTYL